MSNIGRVIRGYCWGYFGESYGPRRVEAEGYDWIVARDIDSGDMELATFFGDKEEKLQTWEREYYDELRNRAD
jgi:hypothetical protein